MMPLTCSGLLLLDAIGYEKTSFVTEYAIVPGFVSKMKDRRKVPTGRKRTDRDCDLTLLATTILNRCRRSEGPSAVQYLLVVGVVRLYSVCDEEEKVQ